MSDEYFGLLALGLIAAVGVVMVRSFSAPRGRAGASHDGGYVGGPGAASTSSRDDDRTGADRGEGGGWFGGLFGSSDTTSNSSDGGSSDSDSGSGSGGGDGGGGD